jgi:NADH-quinone oxidoreductase subunit J
VNSTPTGEAVLFWILGPLSVLAALGMVGVRKAVHSALLLAVVMICLAMFFAVQSAPFLAVVQVVVYTGAVMMLFLFVLMLVGVDSSDSLVETIRGQRVAAVLAGLGFGILVLAGFGNAAVAGFAGLGEANQPGNVEAIARLIFTKYVFAFELTSALLITAAIGSMVLAHQERLGRKLNQRELSIARFKDGGIVTPMPAPGVYARHNAVDTPALLPDGTPSELSVSPVLRARGDVRTIASAKRGDRRMVRDGGEAAEPLELGLGDPTREGSQLGKGPTP